MDEFGLVWLSSVWFDEVDFLKCSRSASQLSFTDLLMIKTDVPCWYYSHWTTAPVQRVVGHPHGDHCRPPHQVAPDLHWEAAGRLLRTGEADSRGLAVTHISAGRHIHPHSSHPDCRQQLRQLLQEPALEK